MSTPTPQAPQEAPGARDAPGHADPQPTPSEAPQEAPSGPSEDEGGEAQPEEE